jgi:hypothetical protein
MTAEQSGPPIACTLAADDMPGRLAEWRDFARGSVRAVESGPTSARLLLARSDDVLVTAASLAQRETQCCAFFAFSIVLEADERWLSVTVPEDAEEVLASFVEMLAAASVRG